LIWQAYINIPSNNLKNGLGFTTSQIKINGCMFRLHEVDYPKIWSPLDKTIHEWKDIKFKRSVAM